MEVVTATPNGNGVPPFHNHDVHEWSRIDSLTGVLERARLETDHWTANTSNSSHNYGKVVDTRARSNADGAVHQQARRQLEVFQSSVPGGRLQVIKSHTVSSSRWTSKSPAVEEPRDITQHFQDLELSINPLDISSQKSKATVGRSVGRRPPSRPRVRDDASSSNRQTFSQSEVHSTVATNLHRISRLCNQVHENAVKQTFGKYYHKPPIHERESGDGVEIVEIECANSKPINGHSNLIRTKSTSSEDIHLVNAEKDKQNKSIEDLEDLEQLQNWRRTSKIRRSLQFPTQNKPSSTKPLDLPVNTGSVRKIREDLETGRRLNTALRGNNVDLEALDQILQLITSPTDSINNDKYEQPEKDEQITAKKQKRHSFVTVESLQEVRGRLRRTSSPIDDIYKNTNTSKKDDEPDDGIVTEDALNSKQCEEMPVVDNLTSHSRVRSYVYGMEALMNKKPIIGTGSLESRTSRQVNGTCGSRNEDWYNRRKSYGFEQVHGHQDSINSISKNKTLIESSTDSGICRSSEIVLVPTTNKGSVQLNKSSDFNSEIDSEREDKCVFNRINKYDNQHESVVSNIGNVRRYASIFENKKESSPKLQDINYCHERSPLKDYEGTRITIPIVPHGMSDNCNGKELDYRIENSPFNYNRHNQNGDIKRHSIAVDESKYVTRTSNNNNFRRTSLAVNDNSPGDSYLPDCLDDDFSQGKRHKKVEFCKTEVHFAVDSGRVNIVATDEKPPPTNNFRRRRRSSATLYNNLLTDANKNGLPILHFGDSSYEKSLYGFADHEEDPLNLNDIHIQDSLADNKSNDILAGNTVTVSTNQSNNYQNNIEDDQKENIECETPKGILKNKPIKPKPYLLGDDPFCNQVIGNDDKEIWGVKLKPVYSTAEPPMWKSTVTLKSTLFDKNSDLDNTNTERIDVLNDSVHSSKEQTNFSDNHRHLEHFDKIRIVSSQPNATKSSWTVADTSKELEDSQKSEIKGYSTKVNIGCGEAIVIEDHLKGSSSHIEIKTEPSGRNSLISESPKPPERQQRRIKLSNKVPNSPVILRKAVCDSKKHELKTTYTAEKLSSPSLVGQNLPKTDLEVKVASTWRRDVNAQHDTRNSIKLWEKRSPTPPNQVYTANKMDRQQVASPIKRTPITHNPTSQQKDNLQSPNRDTRTNDTNGSKDSDSRPERQKSPNRSILRNPRRSEMAYFGVKMGPSPKSPRKTVRDKVVCDNFDLNQDRRLTKTESKSSNNYLKDQSKSPIYENVDHIKINKNKTITKEFDSSILDELTKAADQILQAVNGYAEEAEKQTLEENKKNAYKKEKLDTISETKSWKQRNVTKHNCNNERTEVLKPKLRHTSSTSSVESISECKKSLSTNRRVVQSVTDIDAHRKKSSSDSSSTRAATKARRLQRASSREALLQSHGSSSEDLPITVEVPLRKPRVVRKTKTVQGTDSHTDVSRNKKHDEKGKSEERIPIGALPTIRHKTAVSTIRSTAEKVQSRERLHRSKTEDPRKIASLKKDSLKYYSSKSNKQPNTTSREPINHRISTAYVPLYRRRKVEANECPCLCS